MPGGWVLGFLVVWGAGLGVGWWVYRRHLPEMALHTLTFLLLLPAGFPLERTGEVAPDLAVDVSRSMDTPAKRTFVEQALRYFRERYPRARILAFAERTVPFSQRHRLRGYPTRPPRLDRPTVVLTDGLWEGWEVFPQSVWPWVPDSVPASVVRLEVPLTVYPGSVPVRLVTPRPGTLRVGDRTIPIRAGTTTVRVSLQAGFHRLVFASGEDTLRRGVLVRIREARVGIYERRPHPDAGALRRVLRDLGYAPLVVLKDRLFQEDRVESGLPPRVWGWFVLDPPPGDLPGLWQVWMDRALPRARWSPHPLFAGLLRARLPGQAPDSLDLIPRGPATWAWILGDVYRLGLREPDTLKRRVAKILERMKSRFPRIQVYPVTDTVVPPDTARFLVEVSPSDVSVRLSLPARALEPGLFEVTLAVSDTGMREIPLILEYGEGADTLSLSVYGVLRKEGPTERVDMAFLEGLARSTGGGMLRGGSGVAIPLSERTETWPRWWFLLAVIVVLVVRWGVQHRRGRT